MPIDASRRHADTLAPLVAFALAAAMLLVPGLAQAASLTGRVVGVSDGDTLTLLTASKTQVKVRLAEIDAPESSQPYGRKAKQALSDLVYGRDISVAVQAKDRYGRTVGRPFVADVDVSAEMVRIGAAWVYRQYLRDRSLLELETEARTARRGLWSLPEDQTVPPWEWRRGKGRVPAQDSRAAASGACRIKGNISAKGERIYHLPGTGSYPATRIDTGRGERWFCSEAEARAAGWRAPGG